MFKLFKRKKTPVVEKVHMINDDTNFSIIEAYKAIRANINFAIPSQGCKKIMICSSFSGEGKTTTCINLAITIAQTGVSVLLIDCDLRRARVHTLLNENNTFGVSNYLSNMIQLDRIIKETHIPNFKVITSGSIPPNPAELLASPKMGELLAETEKMMDYIIIDTPPVCIVSDALPVAKLCNGVILIVNHMETTHTQIKESLEKLKFAGANVVGMILNNIKIKHAFKSYKKYNKYKYDKYSYKSTPEE